MNPLAAIRQRLADCLREQRIRDLTEQLKAAVRAKDMATARAIYEPWRAEILARSPEQCARMELAFNQRKRAPR